MNRLIALSSVVSIGLFLQYMFMCIEGHNNGVMLLLACVLMIFSAGTYFRGKENDTTRNE